MKSIAIIPARGGSKRLPKKNVLDFLGRPIIEWTIDAAIESAVFDRIVVSSEDESILEIASRSGCNVDKRPPLLATDTATVDDVCLDIIDREYKNNQSYDVLCCLYATAPLRTASDIIHTMELVMNGECEKAMAVSEFDFPAFQGMRCSESGALSPLCPDLINKRASDVGKIVVDNGSTYVTTIDSFLDDNSFLSSGMKGYFMPRIRSVDIDVIEDYELALYNAKLIDMVS